MLKALGKVFNWGKASKAHLKMGHPDLAFLFTKVLKEFAIFDFGIIESVRTREEQRKNIESGASRTMTTRHYATQVILDKIRTKLRVKDPASIGKRAHAFDIQCFDENGQPTWDYEYFLSTAESMRHAAIKYDIPIVWGGCWKDLRKVKSISAEVDKYVARMKKKGKEPFIDAGHYHLPRGP